MSKYNNTNEEYKVKFIIPVGKKSKESAEASMKEMMASYKEEVDDSKDYFIPAKPKSVDFSAEYSFLESHGINTENIQFTNQPMFTYDIVKKEVNPYLRVKVPIYQDGTFNRFKREEFIDDNSNLATYSVKSFAIKNLQVLKNLLKSTKDKVVIYQEKPFTENQKVIRLFFIDQNHETNLPQPEQWPKRELKRIGTGWYIETNYEDGTKEIEQISR